jgi:hypothetical protein
MVMNSFMLLLAASACVTAPGAAVACRCRPLVPAAGAAATCCRRPLASATAMERTEARGAMALVYTRLRRCSTCHHSRIHHTTPLLVVAHPQ